MVITMEMAQEMMSKTGNLDLRGYKADLVLPENLVVRGSLNLQKTGIKKLPKGLVVKKNLYLFKSMIEEIPADLRVGGNINLSGCEKLESLPDNFTVEGNLFLRECPHFYELPKGLFAKGSVDLCGTPIRYIPRDVVIWSLYLDSKCEIEVFPELQIEHSLVLQGCASIRKFSKSLKVGGNLCLEGCSNLELLPDNLYVGESAMFKECNSMKRLPKNLRIRDDLHCINTGVRELPQFLDVGHLHVDDNSPAIPDGFKITGSLTFTSEVKSLPRDLDVGHTLSIQNNPNITKLPDNLKVGGLCLSGCSNLSQIPPISKYIGSLIIDRTNITELPDTLSIEGNFKASPYLEKLPTHIKCRGNFALEKCRYIREIPEDILLGKSLDIKNCPNFSKLPDNLVVPGDLMITGCPKFKKFPKNLSVGFYVYGFSDGQYIAADTVFTTCYQQSFIASRPDVHKLQIGEVKDGYICCPRKYDYALMHIKEIKKFEQYTLYVGVFEGQNIVTDGKNYVWCEDLLHGISLLVNKK